MTQRLRIAAAQFPVGTDMAANVRHMVAQMGMAASFGADIVVFPETSLPGYAPRLRQDPLSYDWPALDAYEAAIADHARYRNIWVAFGTVRPAPGALPRNCLQIVSPDGRAAATYEKRRLYGKERRYFSAGDRPTVVEINGVRCGFLICYDNCFPELYAEYRDLGVKVLFHAFFNAGNSKPTSIAELMQANLIVRAADHGFWIAASNASQAYSPLPACVVRPDGSGVHAPRHAAGIILDDFPGASLGWTYDNRRS